jgi:23S rRNA (cytidine2498-2'-O)-methyltransferase
MGVEGFVKARPDSGFAVFQAHQDAMGEDLGRHLDFSRLVFPRQLVRVGEMLTDLPESDRVGPIVAAARAVGDKFAALWTEMPDTNDGKALAALARPLAPHLEKGLRKSGVSFDDPAAAERLHVFFVGGRACYVGVSAVGNSAPWPMGIPRLRMPAGAPSRSALKLAEALMQFVPGRDFAPGLAAVDLGASPGGWSAVLVKRGFHVVAVDNGPMDAQLLESGQVKHRRVRRLPLPASRPGRLDGVRHGREPSRIAGLVAKWLAQGWCAESIFNLKLPMKKRREEVERCRGIIDAALGGGGYYLRFKQLYHDREEVTGYLSRRAAARIDSATG